MSAALTVVGLGSGDADQLTLGIIKNETCSYVICTHTGSSRAEGSTAGRVRDDVV